jgi:hypothetical protein
VHIHLKYYLFKSFGWAGWRRRYSDWIRAGRYGDRIPVWARFFAPVQTGLGAHSVSCTMGTGSFPEVKSDRDVTLTPHPLLVLWSRKGRAIPLLPLWAVRPVQSLSVCTVPQCLYKGEFYLFYFLRPFKFLILLSSLKFVNCGKSKYKI